VPIAPVVLLAAVLHASWNALLKAVDDRRTAMALIGGATAVICLPVALLATAPAAASWPELGGSVAVHVLYSLLLIACDRDGDFNQVYPLARGLSPPTVALSAVILVGERLSAIQVAGLLIVSAGMIAVALGGGRASRRGLGFAVLTGLAISAYTVLDGVGVRHSGTAVGYAAWLFTGEGALVAAVLVTGATRTRAPGALSTATVTRSIAAATLSILAYGLVLWAQTRGALAVVAALRETSVVFAALLGAAVFGEQLPGRRVTASVAIAAGAVLLAVA
jgi:drug/metabolite transporter (DMT)-like permease